MPAATTLPPVTFASTTSAVSSTTYVVSTTASVPQSAVILIVAGASGNDTSTGVTDTQGNTYTLLASATTNENVQCYTAVAVKPLTGGTDTFTVTWTTATTQQKNIIGVYVNNAIVTDLAATNNGNSATASVTGGTPAWSNEVAIAVVQGANGTQPITAPTLASAPLYSLVASQQAASQQITSVYYSYVAAPRAQTLSAPLNASGQWAFLLVSVATVPVSVLSTPNFVAGFGPQQSDLQAQWGSLAAFYQQRVVFRANQIHATTTIPNTGVSTLIAFDNIFEDPYGGWSASSKRWFCPAGFQGWYQVNVTVWITGSAPQVILNALVSTPSSAGNQTNNVPLVNIATPNLTGSANATWYVYMGPGDSVGGAGSLLNAAAGAPTSLVAGQTSTIEIIWVSA